MIGIRGCSASSTVSSTLLKILGFDLSAAVIVTLPAARNVTLPFASTVATSVLLDVKSTVLSVVFSGVNSTVSFTVSPASALVLSAFSVRAVVLTS